jgi:hypothetical protein
MSTVLIQEGILKLKERTACTCGKSKNMEVEINKNLCLMRLSRKPVSKTEAMKFCEFVKDINRVFN